MVVQITPIAISNIGWRTYIIFATLNFSFLPIIYLFFPETKGLELEDVDMLFADTESVQMSIRAQRGRVRIDEDSEIGDSGIRSPEPFYSTSPNRGTNRIHPYLSAEDDESPDSNRYSVTPQVTWYTETDEDHPTHMGHYIEEDDAPYPNRFNATSHPSRYNQTRPLDAPTVSDRMPHAR